MAIVDFQERPTKADISKEKVTAAGARILRERGYAGTTMRAVADEVGLKAGSLYYHYKSKADLVAAILETGVRSVSSVVTREIATLPPSSTYLDRLKAAIRAHLSAIVKYEDYSLASRRVFGQVPPEVRRQYVRERNAYGNLWRQMLEAARDAGEIRADIDIKLTYWFLLGALNSAAEWHHPETQSLDDMADEFFEMVTRGLAQGRSANTVPIAAAKRSQR